MDYVYMDQSNIVREIIPEYSGLFPGVPAARRYSPDFLKRCLPVEDGGKLRQGMEYLPQESRFVWPVQFLGEERITLPAGTGGTIPILFYTPNPVPGAWAVAPDSQVSGTVDGETASIGPLEAGEYRLTLAYRDEFRTIRQDIVITAENPA